MGLLPRKTFGLLLTGLLFYLPAQAWAEKELPLDKAELELATPPGTTVRVDGRVAAVQHPLPFAGLQKGQIRQVKVEAEFQDGSRVDRTILLQGGWRVQLPLRPSRGVELETVTQFGHNHLMNSVAFSSDEKYIVTGGTDHLAILWDASTGRKLRTFLGHTSSINSVAFSPDGKSILTGSSDRTASLWHIQSGKRLRTFGGHNEGVNAVAFTSDGQQILTGSKDKTVILWNATTGQKLRTFQGAAPVTCLACSPDDKLLAMGLEDKKVLVWSLSSGEKTRSIDAHLISVSAVVFSPDGKRLLTGGDDELVCLWDVSTGQKVRNFRGHDDAISSVAFTAGGKHFISGARDRTAIVWDFATGEKIRVLKGHTGRLSSVAMSRDGHKVLVVSGRSVILWSIPDGLKLRLFGGQADGVGSVAFGPDGRQLWVGTDEGAGIHWHEGSGLKLWSLNTNQVAWRQVFSHDGKRILISHLKKDPVVWDTLSGRKVHTLGEADASSATSSALAFRPDGKQALTGTGNGADLWDVETGKVVRSFVDKDQMVVEAVAFSPDGKQVLVAAELGGTILWDVTTAKKLHTFDPDEFALWANIALFSPNGKQVLTHANLPAVSNGAMLWDAATGKKIVSFPSKSPLLSAVFSPDGTLLVTGALDGQSTVWDTATARKIFSLMGHTDGVNALAFSPDGRRVLTGSRDGTARLWDVATGDELVQLACIDGGSGWLALTSKGLFDGSRIGREKVCFRLGEGLNVVVVDRFFQDFYYPGLLAQIWRGERPFPGKPLRLNPAPLVKVLVNDQPVAGGRNNQLTIDVAVTSQGGGIKGPWLQHNGATLPPGTRVKTEGKTIHYRFPVSLVPGDNRIEVRAATDDGGRESDPVGLTIPFTGKLPEPELHVVAIGINRYAKDSGVTNLDFCVSDTRAVAQLFQQRSGKLYRKVHVRPLLDEQATRAGILQAVREVSKKANPQDTLVVYVAGHGIALGQRFYLIPHDFQLAEGSKAREPRKSTIASVGLRGFGDTLDQRENAVRTKGLAIDELGEALSEVPALKRVLIFDTCHSGSAIKLAGKKYNPFAFRGAIERFSRAQGVYSLSATAADELAAETKELGHSILTYTLLAGMGAAKGGPLLLQPIKPAQSQVSVDVLRWFDYARTQVPGLYQKYVGRAQSIEISGEDQPTFPLLRLDPK